MDPSQVTLAIVDEDDLDAEAQLHGRRVAYVYCIREGERLKIADIRVDDELQHRGIGSALLRLVLSRADKVGVREVWGVVTDDDLTRWPGLLNWYERRGFTITDPDTSVHNGPTALKQVVRRLDD